MCRIMSKSKVQEKEIERTKKIIIPLYCDAVIPITAKLLNKYKDVQDIDDELQKRREEYDTRMKNASKRKADLEEKEKMLLETLKRFNNFIKDSEVKKRTASEKYRKEQQSILEKDKELEKLKNTQQMLAKKKETLEKYVEKYLPAKQFLDAVAAASVQYDDAGDVMSYYDTVVAVHQELVEKEQCLLEESDREREKLIKYKTETTDQILALRNQLYALQWEQEKAYHKILEMEAKLEDLTASREKKLLTKRQVIMGIDSMYAAVCDFEKLEPLDFDTLEQMDKLHEFILSWSEVVSEVKAMEEKKNE